MIGRINTPDMKLLRMLRRLRRAPETLIEVRIRKDVLLNNLKAFREAYGKPVAPVLKSNAYGHGLVEVAEIVSPHVDLIVVDSLYEAAKLRHEGINTPLLVVGYTTPETYAQYGLRDVSITLTSLDGIRAFTESQVRVRVHIKIDTGMRRQGIVPSEIPEAIDLLKSTSLEIEGVCSHFADADGAGAEFTEAQIKTWNEAVKAWRSAFPDTRYFHIAATAGSAFSKGIDANLIRLGTGLYGFRRHESQTFDLKPVLSMHSVVTGIKNLLPGESIGYNCTFTAQRPMRVATIPVGYFEGIDRRLSNAGSVSVNDRQCAIVGRVSMNITSIDVSDSGRVALGTSVVVFSDDAQAPNSLKNLADLCGTTPLELLVHIPQHLRRVVV